MQRENPFSAERRPVNGVELRFSDFCNTSAAFYIAYLLVRESFRATVEQPAPGLGMEYFREPEGGAELGAAQILREVCSEDRSLLGGIAA